MKKTKFNVVWVKAHTEAEFLAVFADLGTEAELQAEYAKIIAEPAPTRDPVTETPAPPVTKATKPVKNVTAAPAEAEAATEKKD